MNTVLILGARSDIAQAIAHRFGREGSRLILAARRASTLETTITDLKIRYGIEVQAVDFDALDYPSHPGFYQGLDPKPDVCVLAFGYLGDVEKARHDFHEAATILHTNFTGAVSILTPVADDFEGRRAGSIIGISSVAGDRGRQSNYVYGSAKAGFSTYLAGLRNRLTPAGVQVLTVKPGYVATRMTEGLDLPPALTAQPEEVAEDVYRAFVKHSDILYTRWMWRYVMLIIRHIPEFVFKRLSM